jgi:5-methylcytosine-specific restriction endonuclease McrA
MAEDKPCPYCTATIAPGGRGRPRKTCGATSCQKAHQRALAREWSDRHPGYYRDYKRRWRAANPERHRESTRAWWEANRDAQYEVNRQWRDANPERYAEMLRDWGTRNRTRRSEYRARRRARKANGFLSERDWSRLVNRLGGRCFYCGSAEPMTIDHIIPLARGGRHTIGNVIPACLSCNCSKQDRLIVEWRAARHHRRGRRGRPVRSRRSPLVAPSP